MKILLLSNKAPWPPRDGGAAATLYMISALRTAGTSVKLLSLNTLKHHASPDEVRVNINDATLVDIDTSVNLLKYLFSPFFSSIPYQVKRFQSERYVSELKKLLEEDFDIVQIEGLAMLQYIDIIRKYSSSKVVYRSHNIEYSIWQKLANKEKNIFKKLIFRFNARSLRRFETEILDKVDALVAISSADLKIIRSHGFTGPALSISPFPVPEIEPVVEKSTGSVAFIGALDWLPNIQGLTWFINNVWPSVTSKIPWAKLHVAGRNPSKKIRKLCSRDKIYFEGETADSAEFIAGKEVFISPLLAGSGIRMKILGALSMKIPVVATKEAVSGLEPWSNDEILTADDPVSCAGLIIKLLQDKNLRETSGRSGLEYVRKNYNILASAEKLKKFYTELI